MSTRVYAHDANPASDPFLYRTSNSSADDTITRGKGRYIDLPDGRRVLQLYPPVEFMIERGARNQVLVLGGHSNKNQSVILHPHRLHYPVPHAGDRVPMKDFIVCRRRRMRSDRKEIRVSRRSKFNHQAL